jgi:predicted 3-demethylubiquinone-9 3-methyltransferase (glyoxalase superfamily)
MRSPYPCLWFDGRAEEAVAFYATLFPRSRVVRTTRYGNEGAAAAGRTPGSVMTIEFSLARQRFLALNGGPMFRFTEAVSLVAECDDQREIDRCWRALSDGGEEQACGWVKDRYGLSWQVVPASLGRMLASGGDRAERVMAAVLGMRKIDLAAVERAYGRGAPRARPSAARAPRARAAKRGPTAPKRRPARSAKARAARR